jgi:hypothetical protein
MNTTRHPAKTLKGLSFDVSDLILIRSRSEAHGLRVVVELDHGSDVEEYEEVLAFHAKTSPQCHQCHWLMWRNENTVFVRSNEGRARRYRSVTQAIDALVRTLPVISPDTRAKQCEPDPIRTLADAIRDAAATDADPCVLMGTLVEAAVYTLATRVPAIHQDVISAELSQLLTDRLEQYRLLR